MLSMDVSWRTWLGAKDEVFVRPAMCCRDYDDDLAEAGAVLVLTAGEDGDAGYRSFASKSPRLYRRRASVDVAAISPRLTMTAHDPKWRADRGGRERA